MKRFTSSHQKIGKIGEDIAVSYLARKGFSIIERNYTRKCGEIDVVAMRADITHFIEVKSVSETSGADISRETDDRMWGSYRPEDQVHERKRGRMRRVVREFIVERHPRRWVFDVMCVYIDFERRSARVRFIEDQVF